MVTLFNTVFKRRTAWIKSSLLLKIQWKEHHYLYTHRCQIIKDLKSHDHNDAEKWIHSWSKGAGIL